MSDAQQQPELVEATKPQQATTSKKATPNNSNEGANKKKGGKVKAGVIDVEPIKGTRDFPPEEMRIRNWLFNHWKAVAKSFAFEEFDAPILESEDLYKRKAGEEITEQMYNFKDKSDTPVALRPEMTPSLARLVLQKGKALLLPIRWFSIPQCWRYETTIRGRKREHFQWNMDIFGVKEVSAEAELLSAITTFFENVGFTAKDIVIKVSSRKVLQTILESFGITGDKFAPTCIIVDKLDKLEKEDVFKQLAALDISMETAEKIINVMSVKDIDGIVNIIGSDNAAVKELQQLFDLAKAYGYYDYLQFDASVVRGLAYYTGVVFESVDRTGGIPRAICGGGRYDRLLSTYGAKQDIPACGFGFGDCVIKELLKDKGLLPELNADVDDVVVAFDEALRPAATMVATKLRKQGRSVDMILEKKKITWCFSYADRVLADRVIMVAPEEWKNGLVRVKKLRREGGVNEEDKGIDVPFAEL